ncbi:excisionase family DNA binding protein [Haloactinopolyspora alba]|uniref:Excisionase family DNA binding protein n=1 Tax=Haloactinopolyspora alba TaxID=648780 RepID=A0A2P8E071_9ACTN|nr:excisionase family DNA binding protein [Haloactinopolyspora alba]
MDRRHHGEGSARRPDGLWSPEETAEYLGVPLPTLYGWNSRGTGPKYMKLGRHCRYDPAIVIAWAESRSVEQSAP